MTVDTIFMTELQQKYYKNVERYHYSFLHPFNIIVSRKNIFLVYLFNIIMLITSNRK